MSLSDSTFRLFGSNISKTVLSHVCLWICMGIFGVATLIGKVAPSCSSAANSAATIGTNLVMQNQTPITDAVGRIIGNVLQTKPKK